MRYLATSLLLLLSTLSASAKIVIFWQSGFPTVDGEPVSRQALESALKGDEQVYVDSDKLKQPATLAGADLLILPYGSAFPTEEWQDIIAFLRGGGNLLVIGGQPFHVPIHGAPGNYSRGRAQDAYSRELGIVHTYQAPQKDGKTFSWKTGYSFLPLPKLSAQEFFVLEGRGLNGLGYMENSEGEKVAAPVVVSNHTGPSLGEMLGSRWMFLDFQPAPGYWDSPDGISLIQTAAAYARQGATSFWVEVPYSTLKKGETAQAIVHLRNTLKQRQHLPQSGHVSLQLLSGSSVLSKQQIDCSGDAVDVNISFQQPLSPGFYTIQGTYQDGGKPREFYGNGFWVEDEKLLRSGPILGVGGDFLTKDGKPFFPFGTNYFTTEENGWDFSGSRNAEVWERDFADMERHGVSFVRTGVWMGQIKFLEADGGVSERFLRNVEAYLLCARRHNIPVNFTFFAFDPQTTLRQGDTPLTFLPGGNPYLDPVTIRAEQNYLLSIVTRFKDVPYLSWDLINEPSFSNPRRLWKGNTPNGDPAETQAWHSWLRAKYGDIEDLSTAWSTTPDQLRSFDSLPLPGENELTMDVEHGGPRQVRAADYNLFAQEMFSRWVRTMVDAIRATGSKQLINVGQDEGGVQNRVLNQFYGGAGLSFTTNHTYRQNDALLWDSLAAKVPGIPNIVGETGYQPVILPNGEWRYDELTGFSLIERKWAYGFAGGTSGSLSWDWAREIYFGIERSDGSAKIWEGLMRDMGEFAKKAQTYATSLLPPEVSIVLPQSLQLTQLSHLALEAQQNCVRALYGLTRSEAYLVGEYQIDLLGHPKLILAPSPSMLSEKAWQGMLKAVNDGATLLISGRFDRDPHFNGTDRAKEIGIAYEPQPLETRYHEMEWPEGKARLVYTGQKIDTLEGAFLPDGKTFLEKPLGKGKILFVSLPLELNENLQTVGEVYSYALKVAGVKKTYSTDIQNSGVLIAPARFPQATLYVLSSETNQPGISFHDERSGKQFSAQLQPGRAALLLVGEKGDVLASYNWSSATPTAQR
jgi:hypothetical protein